LDLILIEIKTDPLRVENS